ncbi:MAG: hypothetical protein DRR08_05900 [Candidatus Parabeggiatoa sp. nov. 2]|nr:MAG: hypothetical protein DRR08_05900 [Gammaproteobacteria bacterium]
MQPHHALLQRRCIARILYKLLQGLARLLKTLINRCFYPRKGRILHLLSVISYQLSVRSLSSVIYQLSVISCMFTVYCLLITVHGRWTAAHPRAI